MAIGSILHSLFQRPYASDVCNLRGCYVVGLREASAFSLIWAACVRSARDISRVTSQGQLVLGQLWDGEAYGAKQILSRTSEHEEGGFCCRIRSPPD